MRSEQTPAAEPENHDTGPPVEVDVARTGGIAGITRRWTAQPPEHEAPEWISLIDRCPWDETPSPDAAPRSPAPRSSEEHPSARHRSEQQRPVADGFVWWIRASWPEAHTREAELPDDAVTGAWRELVDAVREWNRASHESDGLAR
jgi:hypothetical protein